MSGVLRIGFTGAEQPSILVGFDFELGRRSSLSRLW